MTIELHSLYGQAYSLEGATVRLDIAKDRTWVGLRRTLDLHISDPPKRVQDVVFPDTTRPALCRNEDLPFLRDPVQLTLDYAVDTVSFHGLSPEQIECLSVADGWHVKTLVHFRYDLSHATLSPKARRAYRKAEFYNLSCHQATSRSDFEMIRMTVELLDFAGETDKEEVIRQINFFEKAYELGFGIGLLAINEGHVLAGMYGVLFGDTAYMLLNGYDPTLTRLYPNDFLYVHFIKTAREAGAKFVCWGDVDPDDKGLIRMKQKYSTYVSVVYSVHWLGGILSCVDLQD